MPDHDATTLLTPAGCRRFVYGIALLTGLGQLAGAVGALNWALRSIGPPVVPRDLVLGTAFAALFGSFGAGILTWLALGRRHKDQAILDLNPGEQPWLARSDWAAGEVRATGGATVTAPVQAAISGWWTVAIVPLVSVLPALFRAGETIWGWLALAFPALGLVLYTVCGLQFVRARRFGVSTFRMASVPGVIGGQLAGVVQIPTAMEAPEGFRVRLSCLALKRRKNEAAHEESIWQDERIVAASLSPAESNETTLPILFAIPFEAHESPRADQKYDTRWVLDVSAALPGVDYHAQFEVPVYRTAESRRDFRLDDALVADYVAPADNQRLLRDAGIRCEPLANGMRLTFAAARNWRSALIVTAFVILFGAICALLVPTAWSEIFHHARFARLMYYIAVGFVLPALTLLFAYVALDLWCYRSTVDATTSGLAVRGGLFGWGRLRNIPRGQFTQISSHEFMASGRNVWYTIQVKPRNQKPITLAKGIHGKLLERAVIETLNTAVAGK